MTDQEQWVGCVLFFFVVGFFIIFEEIIKFLDTHGLSVYDAIRRLNYQKGHVHTRLRYRKYSYTRCLGKDNLFMTERNELYVIKTFGRFYILVNPSSGYFIDASLANEIEEDWNFGQIPQIPCDSISKPVINKASKCKPPRKKRGSRGGKRKTCIRFSDPPKPIRMTDHSTENKVKTNTHIEFSTTTPLSLSTGVGDVANKFFEDINVSVIESKEKNVKNDNINKENVRKRSNNRIIIDVGLQGEATSVLKKHTSSENTSESMEKMVKKNDFNEENAKKFRNVSLQEDKSIQKKVKNEDFNEENTENSPNTTLPEGKRMQKKVDYSDFNKGNAEKSPNITPTEDKSVQKEIEINSCNLKYAKKSPMSALADGLKHDEFSILKNVAMSKDKIKDETMKSDCYSELYAGVYIEKDTQLTMEECNELMTVLHLREERDLASNQNKLQRKQRTHFDNCKSSTESETGPEYNTNNLHNPSLKQLCDAIPNVPQTRVNRRNSVELPDETNAAIHSTYHCPVIKNLFMNAEEAKVEPKSAMNSVENPKQSYLTKHIQPQINPPERKTLKKEPLNLPTAKTKRKILNSLDDFSEKEQISATMYDEATLDLTEEFNCKNEEKNGWLTVRKKSRKRHSPLRKLSRIDCEPDLHKKLKANTNDSISQNKTLVRTSPVRSNKILQQHHVIENKNNAAVSFSKPVQFNGTGAIVKNKNSMGCSENDLEVSRSKPQCNKIVSKPRINAEEKVIKNPLVKSSYQATKENIPEIGETANNSVSYKLEEKEEQSSAITEGLTPEIPEIVFPVASAVLTNPMASEVLSVDETSFTDMNGFRVPRERCFLYGISLSAFNMQHVLTVGQSIEYELHNEEEESVKECWIGNPATDAQERYKLVEKHCQSTRVTLSTKCRLLQEINYIPDDCAPVISNAPRTVVCL